MIKINDELHELLHRSVEKPAPIELTAAQIDANAALKIGSETALVINSDAELFQLLRKPSRRRPDPDHPGHFLWGDPVETEPILLAAERWQTIVDFLDVAYGQPDGSPEPPQEEATPPKPSEHMALTEAQWQPIKNSLAAVGKDADQLTVPTIIGDPPLRAALPWIGNYYLVEARLKKDAPTPKQAAAELQESLTLATALLERLRDPGNYNWLFPSFREMAFPESQAFAELLPPLKGFIADLEHRIKTLAALSGKLHGRNARTEFWRELTRLWLGFNPNAGRFKRRHLQRFLFECSKPFFPAVAETKIAAFIDRYYTPIVAFVDRHPTASVYREFRDQQTNT